jgi:hypothetical protein
MGGCHQFYAPNPEKLVTHHTKTHTLDNPKNPKKMNNLQDGTMSEV